MRILWISTACIGPVARILDMPQSGSSGGWIQSEYEALLPELSKDTEMFFLCSSRTVKEGSILKKVTDEGVAFCVNLPKISFGKKISNKIKENIDSIIKEISPDVIHIWGTESVIVHAAVEAAPNIKKIIFIQGLMGIHYRYLNTYIHDIDRKIDGCGTICLKDKILQKVRNTFWKKQVAFEQEMLQKCDNVIIDNKFSETYCECVKPNINCYYRFLYPNKIFTDKEWTYDNCDRHSIFTVFGRDPLKGLFQLFRAVNLLKEKYPDIKVNIPGPFSSQDGKLKEKKYLSGYEKWLSAYLKKHKLEDNVCFVGKLSPEEMSRYIAKSNVFVNPSCMEVHALSLREALVVGTPAISSLCGSVMEYIKNRCNGLIYRYEEYEMLAYLLDEVFANKEFAENLSENAKKSMREFSGKQQQSLMDIYKTMIN